MVEAQDRGRPSNVSVKELGFVPATVHEHSSTSDGLVLHTRGDDPETDIRIYDGDRAPHRVGEREAEE